MISIIPYETRAGGECDDDDDNDDDDERGGNSHWQWM
jgi:hypothetical protein